MRVFALIFSISAFAATHPTLEITPDQLWQELISGNKRYVGNRADHPHQDTASRVTLSKGQHPGVVILGCSDSRVAPELVFDQGLGDLFVIRNAGNIPDNHVLGSIEYAVEHLGSKLIVVLGHSRCGAVSAAVDHSGREGHVLSVVKSIEPALKACKNAPGDKVDNAVRANVIHVVKEIGRSQPILGKLIKEGRIKVVGARYDLDSGLVEAVR
jgi:carbonic anhydrase